jgi:hypothetical protein
MLKYRFILLLCLVGNCKQLVAQNMIAKNIQYFGAKGDGKTNDTEAFLKAGAFFNERGGNGTLVIPRGVYIVGKQIFSNGDTKKYAYTGVDILELKDIENMTIQGEKGSLIKYTEQLKLGSFDPLTGKIFNDNNPARPDFKYAALIGNCISLTNCRNIIISDLILDGSNKSIAFGGGYDDKGIQLTHNGIFVRNSHAVSIKNINAGYFGLDGIIVSNIASTEKDDIKISDCLFEYNCRQGLSWVGGNYLAAKNCQFNYAGKTAYFSPPGAGVDIEAEVGPVSNGIFDSCRFVNNSGCGILTGGGVASNCQFNNCTFWGITNWSIWVTAPSFSFTGCNIYGSIVHGYNSPTNADATRFVKCYFEDKKYNDTACYGKYLIESEGMLRLRFDSCNFVTNTKPIAWLNTNIAKSEDEKAVISNSHFTVNKNVNGKMVFFLFNIKFKNNTVEFDDPLARQKAYWVEPCCITPQDREATKIIYGK